MAQDYRNVQSIGRGGHEMNLMISWHNVFLTPVFTTSWYASTLLFYGYILQCMGNHQETRRELIKGNNVSSWNDTNLNLCWTTCKKWIKLLQVYEYGKIQVHRFQNDLSLYSFKMIVLHYLFYPSNSLLELNKFIHIYWHIFLLYSCQRLNA